MQKYGSHVSFEFHMSQMRCTKNIDECSLTLKLLVLGGWIVDVVSSMSHTDNRFGHSLLQPSEPSGLWKVSMKKVWTMKLTHDCETQGNYNGSCSLDCLPSKTKDCSWSICLGDAGCLVSHIINCCLLFLLRQGHALGQRREVSVVP